MSFYIFGIIYNSVLYIFGIRFKIGNEEKLFIESTKERGYLSNKTIDLIRIFFIKNTEPKAQEFEPTF